MAGWIARTDLEARLRNTLQRARIVALLGPRQCGKTTLANHMAGSIRSHYFDLENPADEARLAEPMTALGRLEGLVIIDEVQRAPDLFPVLRVLADRPRVAARFLLLGSASPELVRVSS
jgi:predicted AAA+ superfamily ATPase